MGLSTEETLAQGVECDRAGEHDGHERIGERVAADFFKTVEDLHRSDARIIENQRYAEFSEGPNEYDGAARK